MSDPAKWKITQAQRKEIAELLDRLGWTQDYYEKVLPVKVDDMLWHQANSCISGLTWLTENKTAWTIKL